MPQLRQCCDRQMGGQAGRVIAPVQVIDGARWCVCPCHGADRARVSATVLGDEWAAHSIERHVELHHKPWR